MERMYLDFYGYHDCVPDISNLISKLNGVNATFTPLEIECWFNVQKILYPATYGDVEIECGNHPKVAIIKERKDSFVKTIIELTWKK